MSVEKRIIFLRVPKEFDDEIRKIVQKRYRSRQEFILECVREKLDRLEKQEAKA
jgi:Arc/MetJ-type ribon-helix-helix transcriptional regulator